LACGFVDDEGKVAGAHHGRAVALLEEVRSAEEEDEHGGVFFGGFLAVFLALGKHVGDGGLGESFVEGVEHLDDALLAHRLVDGWGDAVGLGRAALGGVDRAAVWAVWVCVEDVHGGIVCMGRGERPDCAHGDEPGLTKHTLRLE